MVHLIVLRYFEQTGKFVTYEDAQRELNERRTPCLNTETRSFRVIYRSSWQRLVSQIVFLAQVARLRASFREGHFEFVCTRDGDCPVLAHNSRICEMVSASHWRSVAHIEQRAEPFAKRKA